MSVAVADGADLEALVEQLMVIDDEASSLYASAGMPVELAREHPFVRAERARWERAAREGRVLLALGSDGRALGFAAYGHLDGVAYLDQLAVRPDAMRRGIGRRLTEAVAERVAAEGERWLWLTTYAHLPWNAPYYERLGFVRVDEAEGGPELRATLQEQRRVLPAPEQRVAMRRALAR